jgi:chloramphenicol 3-O phosphotransferase
LAVIILLNGVGSVGKSSIASALQAIARDPFLHVEMDAFLNMMPNRFWDHPDGLVFRTESRDGKPSVVIKSGPVAERTLSGMRQAVAAMARAGNNLIVDDVLLENEMAHYADLLAGFTLHVVGLFAPLHVLEERERQRGDRQIGLARWQYDRVHQGKQYDLQLDTSKATPMECAQAIKRAFAL